jgi:formylglycine-generating enzyme required for sulfatase activity
MKKIVFLIAALLLVLACASSKAVVDTEEDKSDLTVAKETITVKGVSFNMMTIPSGDFLMGSLSNEPDSFDNEHPQHRVSISGFQMGETEVTQGLWKAVMGNNPSYFSECGDGCPVEQVSWNDVRIFIEKLNQIIPDGGFRLPTEAEWEYGCRAGTTTPFSFGKCLSTDQANYDGRNPLTGCAKGEFRKGLVPVAGFSPNAWGLCDMHGNVWEWCQDAYSGNVYRKHKSSNPVVTGEGPHRVYRGGGWRSYAKTCRSAIRSGYPASDSYRYLGFRLSRRTSEK